MKNLSVFFAMTVLAFGTSCASMGKKFTFDGPKSIEQGVTTQSELTEKYGEPFRVGYDNGDLKWTYLYYSFGLFKDTQTQDLAVTFNKDGTVKTYTYSTSLKDEKKAIR